jgi:2-keto-3-deoxy-L-fuconate dehydrogenase
MEEREFSGLRAIVTGGSSGIGYATATLLADLGAQVCILDVVEPSAAEKLLYESADVADDASVRRAVEGATRRLEGLDVVVNNAGIGLQGTIEENSDEDWRQIFEVNVLGIVRVTRASLPALRRSVNAAIVNMCSVAATVGLVRRAAYSATKGAVLALTRAMAADLVSEGIRVNCVSPGPVETPWVTRLLESAPDPVAEREALVARQPHGRLVQPEEAAAAVAYLASPRAGSTTGTALEVDGGLAGLRLPPRANP